MRTFKVILQSLTPLLMHRFGEMARDALKAGTSASIKVMDPAAVAEQAAYRLPPTNGQPGDLYQPAEHIERAFYQAAGFHKIGRRSAKSVAGAAVGVSPRRIPHGTSRYEIDEQSGVNPSTRGRVMLWRPRLDSWRLSFDLDLDETLIQPDLARKILEDAGRKIGIGAFRVAKGGRFGQFQVVEFSEQA
ncbi:MAG: hypothetical protein HY613_07170 [Candidatus Rokubacteria bacterium]|nr:hypothetical protein [Candidatus Rokubacteria bacterium]